MIIAEIGIINKDKNFYNNFDNIPRIQLKITNNSSHRYIFLYNSDPSTYFIKKKVFIKNLFEYELEDIFVFEDSICTMRYNKNKNQYYINEMNQRISGKFVLGKKLLTDLKSTNSMFRYEFDIGEIKHFITLLPGESYILQFDVPEICFYNFESSIQLKMNCNKKYCKEFREAYQKEGAFSKNMRINDYTITDFNVCIKSNKLYFKKPDNTNYKSKKRLYYYSPIYM